MILRDFYGEQVRVDGADGADRYERPYASLLSARDYSGRIIAKTHIREMAMTID